MIGVLYGHGSVGLWNGETLEEIQRISGPETGVLYSGTLRGNAMEDLCVVAGLPLSEVVVWTMDQGEKRAHHTGAIHAMTVTPEGQTLVTCSSDASIHVWDLKR